MGKRGEGFKSKQTNYTHITYAFGGGSNRVGVRSEDTKKNLEQRKIGAPFIIGIVFIFERLAANFFFGKTTNFLYHTRCLVKDLPVFARKRFRRKR